MAAATAEVMGAAVMVEEATVEDSAAAMVAGATAAVVLGEATEAVAREEATVAAERAVVATACEHTAQNRC
jgi:hypothetical protein